MNNSEIKISEEFYEVCKKICFYTLIVVAFSFFLGWDLFLIFVLKDYTAYRIGSAILGAFIVIVDVLHLKKLFKEYDYQKNLLNEENEYDDDEDEENEYDDERSEEEQRRAHRYQLEGGQQKIFVCEDCDCQVIANNQKEAEKQMQNIVTKNFKDFRCLHEDIVETDIFVPPSDFS